MVVFQIKTLSNKVCQIQTQFLKTTTILKATIQLHDDLNTISFTQSMFSFTLVQPDKPKPV